MADNKELRRAGIHRPSLVELYFGRFAELSLYFMPMSLLLRILRSTAAVRERKL